MTGCKLPAMQRLQFFLPEPAWEPEAVNDRRLELLRAGPTTGPHGGGVLDPLARSSIRRSGAWQDSHARGPN